MGSPSRRRTTAAPAQKKERAQHPFRLCCLLVLFPLCCAVFLLLPCGCCSAPLLASRWCCCAPFLLGGAAFPPPSSPSHHQHHLPSLPPLPPPASSPPPFPKVSTFHFFCKINVFSMYWVGSSSFLFHIDFQRSQGLESGFNLDSDSDPDSVKLTLKVQLFYPPSIPPFLTSHHTYTPHVNRQPTHQHTNTTTHTNTPTHPHTQTPTHNMRGAATPLWRVAACSHPSRRPNPIPAITPSVVKTQHLHGAPTAKETVEL